MARRDAAPAYSQRIDGPLHLTDGELELLQRHDVVVSRRWRHGAYGKAFDWIYHRDLPLFVSTEATLHAVHTSCNDLLALAEVSHLMPELDGALAAMPENWTQLASDTGMFPGCGHPWTTSTFT